MSEHRPGYHACPVAGCHVQLPQNMLMCKSHWFMLSSITRAKVWSAWKGFQSGQTGAREYMLVRNAAIGEGNAKAEAKAKADAANRHPTLF